MVTLGQELGATPDGRRAGDYLAPNFSPMIGRDRNGPTAVIKSMTKIDHTLLANGMALDLKLHPTAVQGNEGMAKLINLVQSYINLGGFQLNGINIVDAATLREAQKRPEQHRELQVRVFGFTAYFVTLSPDFQEHVIHRTEHAF
jgi:formate C-acetyltransferase